MSICEDFHDRDASTRFSPLRTALVTLVLLTIFGFIFVPNFIRARSQGRIGSPCRSNLKNLGTALEMYSVDNHGFFPARQQQVAPQYLKSIPSCPAVGSDTYSTGYVVSEDARQYLVFCHGDNHHGVGFSPNYPQYSSQRGVLER